jgi:hypothetical protein
MIKFTDWLGKGLPESTAFTRMRKEFDLGIGHDITPAEDLGSHSTNPLHGKKVTKNPVKKKTKKKKVTKKKKKVVKKKKA